MTRSEERKHHERSNKEWLRPQSLEQECCVQAEAIVAGQLQNST